VLRGEYFERDSLASKHGYLVACDPQQLVSEIFGSMGSDSPTSNRPAFNRHERTRADHATELAEDYVEAVADIIAANGQCRIKDLAARFCVSHVTASRTVARLQRDGLAITAPHAPVELTSAGERLAEESKRKHETVYQFLRAIGVSAATAESDAEGIEHHVSQETLKRMEFFLKQ
jgi:DtxR family transcriptional regulator, manganese transport regulator